MKSRLLATFAAFLLVISGTLAAQTQSNTDTGVARISLIHGDVSTQRGDSGDWATAALNAPIVAGDRISTAGGARTEVQLDYANILRLDENTQATIAALARNQIQVQIGRGLANYSVFKNSEAAAEIDTPNVAIRPGQGEGVFRITVTADDQTDVLVRKGEAEISTPQGSTHLDKGQLMSIRGTGDDTQYKVAEAPSKDDWDKWNNDRDNTIRNAQAWNHTDRYYVGSEDLDAYGSWTTVPDYGPVWVPAVNAGWAPYRVGHWVWEPYWGWTWVSYEPWGWAPYHYGRWFLYGGSWAWWPGPVYGGYYRPVWAPAYVSFFGFGGGFGFGVGFGGGWGSIGWLPIGPCDHFYPWWGPHRNQFNVVNVTNITNITNVTNIYHGGIPPLHGGLQYSNLKWAMTDWHVREGISTVGTGDFGRGRISPKPVTTEVFRQGRFVAGNLPVVPTRESLIAGERVTAGSQLARTQPERFFSTGRPVAKPQPFTQEQAQIQSAIQRDGHFQPIVGGRPSINIAQPNPGLHVQTGNAGESKAPAGASPVSSPNSGWSRFGHPAPVPEHGGATPVAAPGQPKPTGGTNSNWRGFPTPTPQHSTPASGVSSGGSVPRDNRNISPESNPQWHRFERPAGPSTGTAAPKQNPAAFDRNQGESSVRGTPNRGSDWQKFSPASRPAVPESIQRNESWQRFPSPSSTPQVERSQGGSREPSVSREPAREYSRPPLDMRQPIVVPRSSGSSSSGSYGGYRGSSGGSGSYHGSGGGYSAPSHSGGGGGGHSAPSHGSSGGGGSSHSSGGSSGPHRGR